MTATNLELVRSIYAGWERGDFSSSEWAVEDIEFAFAGGPEPASWTGRDAMAKAYGDWLRAWERFRAVPEEYLVLDDERILVLVHNRGRGKLSDIELEEHSVANYFEIRGGKVTRIIVYLDRELAFSEQGFAAEARPESGEQTRGIQPS